MEEKYTLKEFENMFIEAEAEAIKNLDNNFKEIAKEKGEEDSILLTTMSLQNIMAYAELHRILFKK